MCADKAMEGKEADPPRYDSAQTKGFGEVSMGAADRPGYRMNSNPGATFIERVVGFMDHYRGPRHGSRRFSHFRFCRQTARVSSAIPPVQRHQIKS